MLLPINVPWPLIPQDPSLPLPTPLISQYLTTVPVTSGAILTTLHAAAVTLQFIKVTFGALMVTVPRISRPEMTVPAFVITRSPDGVRVTPAGTPVVVSSGHFSLS